MTNDTGAVLPLKGTLRKPTSITASGVHLRATAPTSTDLTVSLCPERESAQLQPGQPADPSGGVQVEQ